MENPIKQKSHFAVMIAGVAKVGMEDYVKRYLKQMMEHSSQDRREIWHDTLSLLFSRIAF